MKGIRHYGIALNSIEHFEMQAALDIYTTREIRFHKLAKDIDPHVWRNGLRKIKGSKKPGSALEMKANRAA